jgi:hypothetical protein
MIARDVFRDQPLLTGARVRLEPLASRHFDGLWPMFGEPEGSRLTGTHETFPRSRSGAGSRRVVDYAFDVAELHRLHLQVFDFNPRAQRAYEKCGFVREGVHRDALRWEGGWHDAISMAILATDPRPTDGD